MLARLRPIWPLATLAFSGAMWAVARFYFQDTLGLQPCPLCLDQRHWHWGVAGVSALAFIVTRFAPGVTRWAIVLIALVLLGSAAMGMYHVAVEQHWVVAQCDARINPNDIRTIDWGESFQVPKCDEVQWSWLGVSMAGWNAITSLVMALLSFAVALAPERKA
jgi:disulfide bond formation protein DsbB